MIRWALAGLALAFMVALALFIGWRLSSEAMAVFVGVLAGVLASVPTSLLVVWITTRNLRPAPLPEPPAPIPANIPSMAQPQNGPPVIVVTGPGQMPGNQPGWPAGLSYPNTTPQNAPRRQFTVIGGEEWEQK